MSHLGKSKTVVLIRTAEYIYNFCEKYNFKLAAHKVLIALHRSAWREQFSPFDDGTNPLLTSRLETAAATLAVASQEGVTKRRKLGLIRVRKGPPTAKWETPLVLVYGEAWRSLRDACSSREWKNKEAEFVKSICLKWSIRFRILTEEATLERPLKVQKSNKEIADGMPPFVLQDDDRWWQSPGRIKIISDVE